MKPERERRNSMSEQKKVTQQNNILWIIMAIAIVAFCAYSFLTSDLEHIEDTNGPDNYALAVITDEDIVKQEMGALNVGLSKDALATGVTFAALNVDIIPAVLFIGVTTFTFSAFGLKIGNVFGAKFKSKAEFAGGLVLVLMGVKILLEHLGVIG